MALQDLQNKLEPLAAQGKLTLAALANQVAPVGWVMAELPVDGTLTLDQATFAITGSGATKTLTIKSTVHWELLQGTAITLTVSADPSLATSYLVTAEFEIAAAATLTIPGVPWFSLSRFTVGGFSLPYSTYSSGLADSTEATLGATLIVGGSTSQTAIPIQIASAAAGGLQLSLNTAAIDLPSINDVLSAFGSNQSGINLPSTLNQLLNFSLMELTVDFDPDSNTVMQIGLRVGNSAHSPTGWEIIPGFLSLNSYQLGLSVLDPGNTRQIGGMVAARLTLGTVDIAVAALHPTTGGWSFQGAVGFDKPIPIGSVISGLGTKFGVTLPDTLQQFTLDNFVFAFDTSTYDASGQFAVNFVIDTKPVELTVTASLARQDKTYNVSVAGQLTIGSAEFDVALASETGKKTFTAQWKNPTNPLQFGDIASAFGWTGMPALPENLDLSLTDVEFTYDFNGGTLLLSAHSLHFGQLLFATLVPPSDSPSAGQRVYLFALDVPLNLKLSDLPLAGEQIPSSIDAGIDLLEISYASSALGVGDVTSINASLTAMQAQPLGAASFATGMSFFAQLTLGTDQYPFVVPLSSASTSQQSNPQLQAVAGAAPPSQSLSPNTASASASKAPGKWFDVGKSFGPLSIDRIGIQYQNDTLMFALDAGLSFGPLAFSMQGLAVGSPLTEFSPVFGISGLGLAYNKPPLQIEGAILRVPDDELATGVKYQFDGMLVLKAETLSLTAIGSYAQMTSGESSLFVFAQLEKALGGPPALFVTALMAGFGFNRSLIIPSQDEVASFPLLLLSAPPAPGQTGSDPSDVLKILEGTKALNGVTMAWITPKTGEYWLAAGLQFTSFELVNTKALLIVQFGDMLQIALLGLSVMQLPKPKVSSMTYAYVELMIRVVIQPELGYFAATAILSKNSYVITPDCHLTGGFAFYLWFGSNPNAGQFVITLGGYHPAFKPPPSFPQVPRLGFNWAVSDVVSIKGDAYFALTTSCIMAGGGLEVLFHDGDLRAWFIAHADFLVSWHPFFYLADISVSIGVSYRLNLLVCHKTISVSLGASVNLWGPPTGGVVHVDLCVVSFSVRFGSDGAGQQKDPLLWTDFQELLPDSGAVCRIAVTDGLYKTQDAPANSSGKLWVVRAKRFSFQTQSAIPASHLQYGDSGALLTAQAGGISIKPMNQSGVTSTHTLKIFQGTGTSPIDTTGWALNPSSQTVPESLWGAPPSPFTQIPALPSADVIPDQASGYAVTAPMPQPGNTQGLLALAVLLEEYLSPPGRAPLSTAVAPAGAYLPVFANDTVGQIATIAATATQSSRTGLFTALATSQIFRGVNGDLSQLATQATHLYTYSPMQQ
ncbi:MAG TPA: DUF6603 domain-containing protein [Edaphobacter sp.]|nr:DUF6603 domain-containing protein [Edaphobacter sp.]